MLAEAAGGSLPLDAAENESGNTATHIAAFGGCIELAQQLVCLGASVGLPNRDGFTPLDSMQASLPALGLSPRPSSPSSARIETVMTRQTILSTVMRWEILP